MKSREAIIADLEQRLAEGWDASCFPAEACRIILADMMTIARILTMPEADLNAEFVAEGKDPDAVVTRMRERLNEALAEARSQ